jgi:hypothetical protein
MSDTRGIEPLLPEWCDKPDEWTEVIHAAYPTRSGSHDEYGTAMQMVGNRYSKASLVALVNWLLVRLKKTPKARTFEGTLGHEDEMRSQDAYVVTSREPLKLVYWQEWVAGLYGKRVRITVEENP